MKKIAVIGASYLQMPIVKKAKDMGLEVICFAWNEGAVCKDICNKFYDISIINKEAILDVCRAEKIDAITSIASDVAVPTINYVAQNLGLISNTDPLHYTTNKYEMRCCFQKYGVPSPSFIKTHIDEIDNIDVNTLKFPLIVKPTDRSGSLGVQKITSVEFFKDAVKRACKESFKKEAIIEQCIEGREVSIETISWKGKHHILAYTDKVTTEAPYYVELEHHQPANLSDKLINHLSEVVNNALTALGVKYGASHSEIKITKDEEIFVIEIGARMGGDFIGSNLVELSTGYDFVKGVINVALGEWEEPVKTIKRYSGVHFLTKGREYVKDVIISGDKSIYQSEIQSDELKDIQCSADRSGYFIYQADKRFTL